MSVDPPSSRNGGAASSTPPSSRNGGAADISGTQEATARVPPPRPRGDQRIARGPLGPGSPLRCGRDDVRWGGRPNQPPHLRHRGMAAQPPHPRHPGMAAQPTYPGPRRPPLGCRRPAPAAARESPVASWVPALRCAAAGMTYVGVVARTNPHTSVIAEWPRNPQTPVIPEWRRSRHIRDPGGRIPCPAAPPPRRPGNRPCPPGSRLSAALRPG